MKVPFLSLQLSVLDFFRLNNHIIYLLLSF
nr:MAG TPA: hypothetical protein [Caudoviricetes sp.]